ncbi:efflux RND transporter periplasmic adaptor subunit [Tropicimonas sp. IMCC6043]|uniref:efflux RND transporter periplasmic adaptor subunit n=1 Tax=Tropicimonas sp. IMCC6043 TaxID=2510645 RepID=UPI00101D36EE|nr:efflux RND transporter periplasmic adaptor subunit [Tropicimonas sp. IMCC6043]RYH08672.1 efflux RND transporter periplasmic adaptor subunit [Tropicimonas sp. IMCC6043]
MASTVLRLIPLIAAAVIGGLVVAFLADREPTASASDAPAGNPAAAVFVPQIGLAEVTQMPAAERIRLGGYVIPRRTVGLTAQAPGRVTYVAGEAGERVAAGQVVVALDDDGLQPQYRAAWADLSAQMAALQDGQTQLYKKLYGPRTSSFGGPGYDAYERMAIPFYNMAQSFFGNSFPGFGNTGTGSSPLLSQQQAQRDYAAVSAARTAYEQQLTRLAAAQSQVDGLDAQLRNRRAVAPWNGAILTRHVRVGDIVQPGQPLAEIADVDELDVEIEVPIAQLANIRVGDQVPVTINHANLWAPVAQIFPAASPGQHTVTVKLALPSGTKAAPGMYVLAWISQPGGGSPSQLSPAIPTTAIVRRGSLPVAFAVAADGTVEMRVLRIGDEQGDRTAVLSGLVAGERVVAHPSPDLKSGDPLSGHRP